MTLLTRMTGIFACVAAMLVPSAGWASEVIAHRGVYHDVDTNQTLSENSYYAVVRAHEMGLRGIELDLRLDASDNLLVVHDFVANRATTYDGAGGKMNAVDVRLRLQSPPPAVHFAAHPSSTWGNVYLKNYGRNAQLINNTRVTGDIAHIQSLYSLLNNLKNYRRQILDDAGFMVVLDIQDPKILKLAADQIKAFGVENHFYLKFFATKALYNAPKYRYNGADTCYVYAKDQNLTGLNVIPQVNDGELDINENDNAGILAFQTRLTIDQYLQCWADAQAQHADAAKMPIVSASVPADNGRATAAATAGAHTAIRWAQTHGRKTMTIVPNPDAGRLINGGCALFSFQANDVSAIEFPMRARQSKAGFAADPSVRPDYVIYDVMGDYARNTYHADFATYTANLC